MSAIDNAAEGMAVCFFIQKVNINADESQVIPNLTPSTIRLDILVELIRGRDAT